MVFATSRHAILGFVHIDNNIFFFKQPLVLFCSSFKLWWFSLVPYWIRFPTPIHMLHSDFVCENHTASKMRIFTKFMHFYTQLYSGLECQIHPPRIFFFFSPENPLETAENPTEKATEIHWEIPLENSKFSFVKSGLFRTKLPTYWVASWLGFRCIGLLVD